MNRHEKRISRPERIRAVFRKHARIILTRAEIITQALGGQETLADHFHNEKMYLSKSLSRMVEYGEVQPFPLLGKKGYMYHTDAEAIYGQ